MFEKHRSNTEYVALLDIGSGSVTATIVYSNLKEDRTEVVWTHHERLLLKQTDRERGKRPLLTTLMQTVLVLGSEGVSALRAFDARAHISTLQVGVSAPWSYTVTKTVRLQKEKPFNVNKQLLDEIQQATEQKAQEEINENEIARTLDLTVVSRAVTELRGNDYPIKDLRHQSARSISLTISSVIIQDYLHKAIVETQQKVLPQTKLQIVSTMLQLYYALRDIHPEMQEYCIVSVTLEATEIGVVREGVLSYSTHEPYGIIDLAKDISEVTGVPLAETYGQLQHNDLKLEDRKGNAKMQEQLQDILATYAERTASLLQQTGDDFTIPKTVYLYCNGCTQRFMVPHIEAAAEQATGFLHIVHVINDERRITKGKRASQACIERISGLFFHRYGQDGRFTFL